MYYFDAGNKISEDASTIFSFCSVKGLLTTGVLTVGTYVAKNANEIGKVSVDLANTFKGEKFRSIILKPGTRLIRVFKKDKNNPIGSFTTRGRTAERINSAESAISELALKGTSNIRPNRITTLEVQETIEAKIGYIKGGGVSAVQIVIDRSDLGKVRELRGTRRILK